LTGETAPVVGSNVKVEPVAAIWYTKRPLLASTAWDPVILSIKGVKPAGRATLGGLLLTGRPVEGSKLTGAIAPVVGSNVTVPPVDATVYTERPLAGSTACCPVVLSVRGVRPPGITGVPDRVMGRPVVVLKLTGAVDPAVGSNVTGPEVAALM
jgi:hypothetical protein